MTDQTVSLNDLALSIEGIAGLITDLGTTMSDQFAVTERRFTGVMEQIVDAKTELRAEIADLQLDVNDRFNHVDNELGATHNEMTLKKFMTVWE